jgi:hypothetical protein
VEPPNRERMLLLQCVHRVRELVIMLIHKSGTRAVRDDSTQSGVPCERYFCAFSPPCFIAIFIVAIFVSIGILSNISALS